MGPARTAPNGGGPRHTRAARPRLGPVKRPAVPPDDRLTAILPPVRANTPGQLRDPIEVVKAALDGRPPRGVLRGATRSSWTRPRWKPDHRGAAGHPPGPPPVAARLAAAAEAAGPGLGPGSTGRGSATSSTTSTGSGCGAGCTSHAGAVRVADRHLRDGLFHRRDAQAR